MHRNIGDAQRLRCVWYISDVHSVGSVANPTNAALIVGFHIFTISDGKRLWHADGRGAKAAYAAMFPLFSLFSLVSPVPFYSLFHYLQRLVDTMGIMMVKYVVSE